MKRLLCYITICSLLATSCASHEGLVSKTNQGNYEITEIKIKGAAYSTPIKTENNTVVLGTHKKSIYFLTPDSIKNVFRTKLWVHATPEIVYDSLIAIGSYDGNMYFFTEDGKIHKTIRPGGRVFTNPVQLDDNWVSFATASKGLWYYNIHSDSIFLSPIDKFTHGSPTKLGENQVCVGSNDKTMYFFDKNGELISSYNTTGWVMHSKALPLSDSTVVFGSYDNRLYSISSSGKLLWYFETNGKIHASPQQFTNGNIICGSFDKNIYIIDQTGQKVAEIPTKKRVVSSASIFNNDNAVVGSYDKHLYILSVTGEVIDKVYLDGKIFSSPIILDDGSIFCATTNGKAFFIRKRN